MHSQETSEGLSLPTPGTNVQAPATGQPATSPLAPTEPVEQGPETRDQAAPASAPADVPVSAEEVGDKEQAASAAKSASVQRIRIGSQRSGRTQLKARPLSEPPLGVPLGARRAPVQKPSPQPPSGRKLQSRPAPPPERDQDHRSSAESTAGMQTIDTAPSPSVQAAPTPPSTVSTVPEPAVPGPQAAIEIESASIPPQQSPTSQRAALAEASSAPVVEAPLGGKTPLPNLRAGLSPELEAEVQAALGGLSLEEILEPKTAAPLSLELAPESRHIGRVVRVTRDSVFVDLGSRNQGMLPLAQLAEPPAEGAQIEVIINRFDPEEGLYHISLPRAAAAVGDWSSVAEGMVVEARVTGVNKGGLECEVSNLRGFIPASQAAAWRVEDLSTLLGERLLCVVTEVDAERRKLVLSRRAMIEREREEARQKLIAELAEGQVREGVVRSLQDFGAFVDLGGVDGLIHVSQLSWQRVQHPSEVLQVGQRVKVKIRKYDAETGKLSLSLRDLEESPWATAAIKYPPTSRHQGVVTRLAQYGAFVQLEPGIEGMVHISELAHGRVWRTSDVVQVGQQVEVQVLSVDAVQQRISLSLKAAQPKPEPAKAPEPEPEESEPLPPPRPRKTPLRGGLGGSSGGERFGLKW